MKRKIRLFPIMTIALVGGGENESFGIGTAFLTMIIVIAILVALYLLFKLLSGFYSRNNLNEINKHKGIETSAAGSAQSISGEVNAAIVMALYLYQHDLHDVEKAVLTIKKVSRTYSPWSSKIYGMNSIHK